MTLVHGQVPADYFAKFCAQPLRFKQVSHVANGFNNGQLQLITEARRRDTEGERERDRQTDRQRERHTGREGEIINLLNYNKKAAFPNEIHQPAGFIRINTIIAGGQQRTAHVITGLPLAPIFRECSDF